MLEGIASDATMPGVSFAISRDGSLAYVPGKPVGNAARLLRVDRAGVTRPLTDLRRLFAALALSPDGRRLALEISAPNSQIWVYDLERGTLTPQTRRFNNSNPIWTPDGRRLTFTSNRDGPSNLYWQPADGSGPVERLTRGGQPETSQQAESWSPDGKVLVFSETTSSTKDELWLLRMDGDRRPQPLFPGQSGVGGAGVSPNGRWLAYVSVESGRDEIYVKPLSGSGGHWPISGDGGEFPVWSRDGGELFYRSGDRTMAVTIGRGAAFSATKPRKIFEAKTPANSDKPYDVTPSGEFVVIAPAESETPFAQVNVVVNWFQEVRPRVAAR